MTFNSTNAHGNPNLILVAYRKRGDILSIWIRCCEDGNFARQGYTDAHIRHAHKVLTKIRAARYLAIAAP